MVDLFAVIVLVGLIASSIRRYILRPPGLQRTADATIVVSLIAALMVTYLMAEAGGHVKQADGSEAGHWGQTWLPFGTLLAQALTAMGVHPETIVHLGVGAWWVHALILLFFLVYLPYSKHMHLLWAPAAVFFAELPHKGVLLPSEEKEAASGDRPAQSLGWIHLADAIERLCLRRVRAMRASLPRGRQRGQVIAPAGRPRSQGIRLE